MAGGLSLSTSDRSSERRRRWSALIAGTTLVTATVLAGGAAAGPGIGAPVAADRDSLGRDLDAVLAHPSLAGADVGLVVRTLGSGGQNAGGQSTLLYRRSGERRQQPASNLKLVTSAAALEALGPDHRFSTTVSGSGRISGSVLRGDLYLKGTGDPTMLAADYGRLAEQVAGAGIRVVTGRLVADDTWFDAVRLGIGWAWDDEPYYYNAQVSALTAAPDTDYDAGSIIVRVTPGRAGEPARVSTEPPTDYVRVDSTAVTGAPGSADTVSVDRVHGGNTFSVRGSIPEGGSPTSEFMAVWEPTGYAAALFRSALRAHGVRVIGPTVRAATPSGTTPLARRQSMPLSELQVPFLKLSNNLHAEILVKSIGRATGGGGSWSAGFDGIDAVLPGLGVDPAAVGLYDGSGLSRMDQIAPDQLTALLVAARGKPWFDSWYQALPIAGVADRMTGGTLRNRMRGTLAENNVHAKTGTLTGVSSLSGYVTAANGERLVFSMVSNNTIGANAKALEDAVAIRLAGYTGASDQRRPMVLPAPQTAEDRRSGGNPVAELECSWTKSC